MSGDAQYGQVTQEMNAQVNLIDEVKRKIIDAESALKSKSIRISELESELVSQENQAYARVKQVQEGLTKLKGEAM